MTPGPYWNNPEAVAKVDAIIRANSPRPAVKNRHGQNRKARRAAKAEARRAGRAVG